MDYVSRRSASRGSVAFGVMMKKRMRDFHEKTRDDSLLTYGRPSVSAWIAAAAVAFAFFILGGFIRTYRQLETLREESRYEIGELREAVRRLREERALLAAAGVGQTRGGVNGSAQQQPRLQALPPSRREGGYVVTPPKLDERQLQFLRGGEQSLPQERGAAALRPGGEGPLRGVFAEPMVERPRYQIGRSYEGGENRLLSVSGGSCQVISVSNDRKRLIVEGGKDIGLGQGARLELCRDGRWMADLRIVDVYENQSACEVLHATAEPMPGDTIRRAP